MDRQNSCFVNDTNMKIGLNTNESIVIQEIVLAIRNVHGIQNGGHFSKWPPKFNTDRQNQCSIKDTLIKIGRDTADDVLYQAKVLVT